MKRQVWLMGTLLLVVLLVGCSSGVRIGWSGSSIDGHMSARYALFTGTEQKDIHTDAGQTIEMDYTATLEEGTLTIAVQDPDGETVWSVELAQDGADRVRLPVESGGRYRVIVQGSEAKGSYDVSWHVRG